MSKNFSDFKKKIWNHFWLTLVLVVAASLIWEFGLEEMVRSAVAKKYFGPEAHIPWFDTVATFAIVMLAMVLSVPALVGGVHRSTHHTATELGKTERRYKSIVESTNDLIFHLDGHGLIVFANPAVRLLGYEDRSIEGKFIGDILYMENKDEVIPRIMTKRIGHRATYNLSVQLATCPESVISSEIPAMEFVMDSCGLWEEADEDVQKRGVEKNFLGTLCIARPVIRPEDLLPQEELEACE